MLISDVAPEADPAGSENRQEIIPESAMDRIAKSGDIHGEKRRNRIAPRAAMYGKLLLCVAIRRHKNALQSNIDDGNYSGLFYPYIISCATELAA